MFSSRRWRSAESPWTMSLSWRSNWTSTTTPPGAGCVSAPMWMIGSPAVPATRCASRPTPQPAGLRPYVHVRRDLWAKVSRALYYDLVDFGEEREEAGTRMFGVASAGAFYAMAPAVRFEGHHRMNDAPVRTAEATGADFFERARERLSLDVPVALGDPTAPAVRGDLDLDPENWKKAGVVPTKRAAVLIAVTDRAEPTVILTQRTADLPSHAGSNRFPGRQDRCHRCDAARRGAARGRGGNRPAADLRRAARLSRPVFDLQRLSDSADRWRGSRPAMRWRSTGPKSQRPSRCRLHS